MDWGNSNIRKKLLGEVQRLRRDPKAAWVKSRAIDQIAQDICGFSRNLNESDNEFFSRIEAHPNYHKFRDDLFEKMRDVDPKFRPATDDFMSELKKL